MGEPSEGACTGCGHTHQGRGLDYICIGCPCPERPGRKVKRRRILVRPTASSPWCVCDSWDGVGQMIETAGSYEFSFALMSDEDVEALGDFPGW